MRRVIHPVSHLLALAAFPLLLTALISSGNAIGEELTYDEAPDQVILEYDIIPSELVGENTEPRVRIYGNGKAQVHYPKFMKKAGKYSTILSKAEIKKALKLIADYGLLSFDKDEIKRLKKEKDNESARNKKEPGQPAILMEVSDQDTTNIHYNLQVTSPDVAKPKQAAKRISYTGLRKDRKRYPAIKEIQGLAHIEDWFQTITRRPDLQKDSPKNKK